MQSSLHLLFDEVIFLLEDGGDETEHLLLASGGTQVDKNALKNATHLVTEDYSSPYAIECQKSNTIIVKKQWVRDCVKRKRILNPKLYSPDPRMIFTGVNITCSCLPDGDRDAIYGGVLALGGQYSDVVNMTITHIVALTTDSEKCRVANNRELNVEIVLPHWFDDCMRLRRRLDTQPYRFPDPSILETNLHTSPPRPRTHTNFAYTYGSSTLLTGPPPSGTSSDIFHKRKVFLASDLGLGTRLLSTISSVVHAANGTVTTKLSETDIFLGQYREGQQYVTISRAGKIVGNLTWLYYLSLHGVFVSPRKHLLHYPTVRGGMQDMRKFRITVSNYTGEARSYLEKLIVASGAVFTRNMKPDNTHLITALASGEKYSTALSWGITVVNHLWLEESYAKWKVECVTRQEYVTWPRETNMMDLIGQTEIDQESVDLFVNDEEGEDGEESNANGSEVEEIQFRSMITGTVKASGTKDIGIDERAGDETPKAKNKRKHSSINAGPDPTPSPSARSATRRQASQVASSKLKDNMEDANLHALELRRKTFAEPAASPTSKRQKKATATVLLTACPAYDQDLEDRMISLGIEVTGDDRSCTHVVSPRIARTKKFLCALPHHPKFVSWEWITSSIDAGRLLDEGDFPVGNAVPAPWNVDLDFGAILSSAERMQGRLYADMTIQITEQVANMGGMGTYVDIVEANGGRCFLAGKTRGIDLGTDRVVLVAMAKTDPAVKRFVSTETKRNTSAGPTVYEREWLMASALLQQLPVDDRPFLLIDRPDK